MTTAPTPGYTGFARLYWMFVGPMLSALVAYQIMLTGGWLTMTNITFLLVIASLPMARWLEFHGGNPHTAEGEPATFDDLRRYAVVVLLLGVVAWAVVNGASTLLAQG